MQPLIEKKQLHKLGTLATLGLLVLGQSCNVLAANKPSYDYIEYITEDEFPARKKPLLEIGPKFLSTGNIAKGFVLPTGAVWTPSLWVYGNYRSAIQTYDDGTGGRRTDEWANRLDLFANLQLSGTERVVLGLTPLHDRDEGGFSGVVSRNGADSETVNELNLEIDTLFIEGDLAELFPKWDYFDSTRNDIGFTIGRQGVRFMDGFLIDDSIDGIGFSKNNIRFKGNPSIVNWRSSVFFGLDGVNRSDNVEDDDSTLYGWFNQIDTTKATYNFDVVYVDAEETGDLLTVGFESVQRIGKMNATFRAAFSSALGEVTAQSDDGVLLFSELSWVPAHTHNNLYLNGFVAIDDFTSAARGALSGGPLGRTGLLFAAQGIGSAPSPLSNQAREAAGAALGYQQFWNNKKTQLTIEVAGRIDTSGDDDRGDEYGVSFRFQNAIGHRSFWQVDSFITDSTLTSGLEYGVRLELQVKL